MAQPCQGHRAKALPGRGQAAVRPCWSCKPTQFLQLTGHSSQSEPRALPGTGWKSQMLSGQSCCPVPAVPGKFPGSTTAHWGCSAPTSCPAWPELQAGSTGEGQWAQKGFAEGFTCPFPQLHSSAGPGGTRSSCANTHRAEHSLVCFETLHVKRL